MVLSARDVAIGTAKEKLLRAIHHYHYLTAQQLCTLLYAGGSLKYVMDKLKQLTQDDYVLRIYLPRSGPYGRPLSVYTLARKGQKYLAQLGFALPVRSRIAEAPQSLLFLEHTLAVNAFLISLELLCRQYPQFVIAELKHELELKHKPVAVSLPDGTQTSVINDSWIDVHIANRYRMPLALEIDRGTEEQKHWRKKVRALLAYEQGSYQAAFGTDLLTIPVVATTGEKRCTDLLQWTEAELTSLHQEQRADLFCFTAYADQTLSPAELFLSERWHIPFRLIPTPLFLREGDDGP